MTITVIKCYGQFESDIHIYPILLPRSHFFQLTFIHTSSLTTMDELVPVNEEALRAFIRLLIQEVHLNSGDEQLHTITDNPTFFGTVRRILADIQNHPSNHHDHHPQLLPFTTSHMTRFHVSIITGPSSLHPGAFNVTDHPTAPNGDRCKVKCGQVAVMYPNLAIPWYLERVEFVGDTMVMFVATNYEAQVVRHLYVHQAWTEERESSIDEE
jgi:hypothetical protein